MVALARFFDWQHALVVVKPETFINWHRTAFRRFWRGRSRPRGRPPLPKNSRLTARSAENSLPIPRFGTTGTAGTSRATAEAPCESIVVDWVIPATG